MPRGKMTSPLFEVWLLRITGVLSEANVPRAIGMVPAVMLSR